MSKHGGNKMKKGFTLTELLLALTIVGVLAVLTVPILMNNIQNKLFATQIKNFSAEIEQFAQDQLIVHKTRDLFDTDFGTPTKLLTDGHFSITKICPANKATKECWKTTATGKDKVVYKLTNGGGIGPLGAGVTIILKNGLMFRYSIDTISGNKHGRFLVDVNGNDKPNIVGRDYFGFFMDSKGHIINYPLNMSYANKINQCKSNFEAACYYCYGALVDNGWKMDY